MRRILSVLAIMACLCIPAMILAMEVSVEITGPQELSALKDSLGKTILTRCISRGIPVENFSRLSVSLSTLGDVISYDALLDTTPPRAFHKDIKDTSSISPTIDEMIGAIFTGTGASPASPAVQQEQTPVQEEGQRIKLPFLPTSITSVGEKIFVSDEHTVYELTGEKVSPLWKARGNNEVLRIYPYGDDLIVLARIMDDFQTFLIHGSEIKVRWNRAVIPLGSGLVSSKLTFDRVFSPLSYQWSSAAQETGASPQIPDGFDVICTITADISPSAGGPEVISYDASDRLTISNGKSTLWSDIDGTTITPLHVDEGRSSRVGIEGDLPARYYVRPRIASAGGRLVTFRNGQGLAGMVSRLNMFENTQILVYTRTGEEFSRTVLAEYPGSYCMDIAVTQGRAAALIVHGKSAYVQFIGL